MSNEDGTRIIPRRAPESAAMLASLKRAMAITPALNRLTFDDADEIRAVFSDLIGHKVDESFSLIPPFYTTGGENIRVGRNVFINQNCTMYDLGGIDIADDVIHVRPCSFNAGCNLLLSNRNIWCGSQFGNFAASDIAASRPGTKLSWFDSARGAFYRTPSPSAVALVCRLVTVDLLIGCGA
jgi:hypothetical protein